MTEVLSLTSDRQYGRHCGPKFDIGNGDDPGGIGDRFSGISRGGAPADFAARPNLEPLATPGGDIDGHVMSREIVGQTGGPFGRLVHDFVPAETEVDAAFQIAVFRIAVAEFLID